MPEGVGYGPQNTSSTGPTLNYIGNHVYGFSGSISINNNEGTLLGPFTTGGAYIVADVQLNIVQDTADDYFYKVKINEELITGYLSIGAQQGTDANNVLQILVAPYSKIEVTAQNVTDSSSNAIVATLVGRIYGKID